MKKLFYRPLAFCCVSFVLFMALGYFAPSIYPYTVIFAAIAATMAFLAFVIFRKRKWVRVPVVLFLALLFGIGALLLSHDYFYKRQDAIAEYYSRTALISAECTDVIYDSDGFGIYDVRASSIDGEKCTERFRLYTNKSRLDRGELFSMSVIISPFADDVNGYAERVVSMGEGLRASCEQTEGEFVSEGMASHPVKDTFELVRESIVRRFRTLLGDREGALFAAVFCGDDSYMSDADMSAVRRSGVSHLLAVSGMHFSVIMGMLAIVISSLGIGIRPRFVVLSVFALIYAFFTGLPPSVIRCAIMLLITYLGGFIGKQKDMPTSLFASMVIMLAIFPYYLLCASFWLSCSATLGIIIVSPTLFAWFGIKHKSSVHNILTDDRYTIPYRIVKATGCIAARGVLTIPELICASLLSSVGAVLFSMPFSILFFGNSSLVSLPCGIILGIVVSAILILSPFLLIFGDVLPISELMASIARAFYDVLHFFADIDGVYISMDHTAVFITLLVFFALIVLTALQRDRMRLLSVLCVVAFCLTYAVSYCCNRYEDQYTRAVSSTMNSSDGISVRTPEGLVIIDVGSRSRSDIKKVIASASSLRKNDIDTYVFTVVPANLEDIVTYLVSCYNVRSVCFPDHVVMADRVICEAAEKRASAHGVEVSYLGFGDAMYVCGVNIGLSYRGYVNGASKPSFYLSIRTENESILWVSRGVLELELCREIYEQEWNTVIFGAYGPRIESECALNIRRLKCDRLLICADAEDGYYGHLMSMKTGTVEIISYKNESREIFADG